MTYVINKTESLIQFGWVIDNVEEINNLVHNAWFKIEDTQPFDYEDIILETIETPEESFNITRFNLPDNLVLSFEDLYHKGFIIGHQNKTFIGFEGFKNKTQWNLDPITFSSPTITVIGGTSASPLNFKDIWDADQTGGWNVVINNNNTNIQYEYNAQIVLGNGTVAGTTWFNDTNKQITFNDNIATARYFQFINAGQHSYVTFGELVNASSKSSKNGIDFINLDSSYWIYFLYGSGNHYFYSCTFVSVGRGMIRLENGHLYNSLLKGNSDILARSNMDYFNIIIESAGTAISYPAGTWDRLTISECSIALFVRYEGSIKNIYARGITTLAYMSNFNFAPKYLINVDSDTWHLSWSGSPSEELFRQYEFDLTVTYPNGTVINGTETGARVLIQHYGENASIDHNATLGEDGTISTQTLTMGFYNQTGGDTLYNYNSYRLEVSNVTGFLDYSKNFTLNEKTEWELALIDESEAGYAGFGFLFFGVIIGLVVGVLIAFGSKR